jgi:DNA-binding GntR family transcriptional regulator
VSEFEENGKDKVAVAKAAPTTGPSTGLSAVGLLPTEAKRKTYEHVYRTLRRALATGQIPEGTHLVETELAAQLGISRTPVRDALRRLQSDGFAERGAIGGLWSRTIAAEEIRDLFLVREELDKLAARLACERAKPEQWEEPRALIAAMGAAVAANGPASEAFSQAHLAFHTSIYRIAFGARFAGLLDNHLLQYLEIAAELSYRDPGRTLPVVQQHEQLLAELASGDAARAVAAAEAHVRRSATDAQSAHADSVSPENP